MKAHIGVDGKSGLTHSLVTTAANEHDLNQVGKLLHGDEEFISADAGYQGGRKAPGALPCQRGLVYRSASRQGVCIEETPTQEQAGYPLRVPESEYPSQG